MGYQPMGRNFKCPRCRDRGRVGRLWWSRPCPVCNGDPDAYLRSRRPSVTPGGRRPPPPAPSRPIGVYGNPPVTTRVVASFPGGFCPNPACRCRLKEHAVFCPRCGVSFAQVVADLEVFLRRRGFEYRQLVATEQAALVDSYFRRRNAPPRSQADVWDALRDDSREVYGDDDDRRPMLGRS